MMFRQKFGDRYLLRFLLVMISFHTWSRFGIIGYAFVAGLNPYAILKIIGIPHGKNPRHPVAPLVAYRRLSHLAQSP